MFQSLTQIPRTQTPVSGIVDQPAFADTAGKHKCLGHKASDLFWVSTLRCSEPCFISTCFSPLAVGIVWDGHHSCTYLHWSDESTPSDRTWWFHDHWWGSWVLGGHDWSSSQLECVTLRRKVMTAPRQSPTQHPAQHPSLCSRDECDGGGHSFQQPSSHATGTPIH